eukprot:PITA_27624
MLKKDEVFSKFVEFKALVEKETGKKLKALRSNNGGEFVLHAFKDFYAKKGDEELIHSCKENLAREFEMKDMGLVHHFLGLEVWQGDGELFASQVKYATKILQRFHMESCEPMDMLLATNWRKENATSGEEVHSTIYRQCMGSLMYFVNTRPDLCYAVNQIN